MLVSIQHPKGGHVEACTHLHCKCNQKSDTPNHFVEANKMVLLWTLKWFCFGHLQTTDNKAIASKHHIREVTKMVYFWTDLGH